MGALVGTASDRRVKKTLDQPVLQMSGYRQQTGMNRQ